MTERWIEDPTVRRFYPDIVAQEGLAKAMNEAARRRGRNIGSLASVPPGVRLETDRGKVAVELSVERRMFLININTPGFTWATGGTDDIELLVDAVADWRGGLSLDDFETKFGFMRLDSFARSLASGDVTSQQWSEVLTADFYVPYRRLLTQIHHDDRLRTLFPTFTHGVLRLRAHPLDPVPAGAFLIESLSGDSYRVKVVGETVTPHVVTSLSDLIEYLRGLAAAD